MYTTFSILFLITSLPSTQPLINHTVSTEPPLTHKYCSVSELVLLACLLWVKFPLLYGVATVCSRHCSVKETPNLEPTTCSTSTFVYPNVAQPESDFDREGNRNVGVSHKPLRLRASSSDFVQITESTSPARKSQSCPHLTSKKPPKKRVLQATCTQHRSSDRRTAARAQLLPPNLALQLR